MRKTIKITKPRKKCTMLASTLTIGSTSAGNNTFLIRLPPAMSDPAASDSDEANHVHGRIPQNMKSAYGLVLGSSFGMIVVKTNVEMSRSSSGLMNDHRKPKT